MIEKQLKPLLNKFSSLPNEIVFLLGVTFGSICIFFGVLFVAKFKKNAVEEFLIVYNESNVIDPIDEKASDNQHSLDLNASTFEELVQLPGIGNVTARNIIGFRPFESVYDLQLVDGIGVKKFIQLRDYFYVETEE